uniref:Uncharacterized protein n=2 Tax=Oxyrrhis marina TaxID=2969 RepID=A0A7S3UIS8_OXYMA
MFFECLYGLDNKPKYFSANCSCAVLLDHVAERAQREVKEALERRKVASQKAVSALLRTHAAQEHARKRLQDANRPGSSASTAEKASAEEQQEKEAQIQKISQLMDALQEEQRQHEEVKQQVDEHIQLLSSIAKVVLALEDSTVLPLEERPSRKAAEWIPLRSTVQVMGYPKPAPTEDDPDPPVASEPVSMLFTLAEVERSELVTELLGELSKTKGGATRTPR